MKKIINFILLLIFYTTLISQEFIVPLNYNPHLINNHSKNESKNTTINTLTLLKISGENMIKLAQQIIEKGGMPIGGIEIIATATTLKQTKINGNGLLITFNVLIY